MLLKTSTGSAEDRQWYNSTPKSHGMYVSCLSQPRGSTASPGLYSGTQTDQGRSHVTWWCPHSLLLLLSLALTFCSPVSARNVKDNLNTLLYWIPLFTSAGTIQPQNSLWFPTFTPPSGHSPHLRKHQHFPKPCECLPLYCRHTYLSTY